MQHDNIDVMSVENHNLICSNRWSKTNQNTHKSNLGKMEVNT